MRRSLFKGVNGQKPREIAARALSQRGVGGYLEQVFEDLASRASLSPEDRRLAQELAYGVARWQATLDWLIARKTDARPQKPALRQLLRLGLYQIFWLDRIPDHAAVHETVELARRSGFGSQAGFVNAVLRACLREAGPLRAQLEELKHARPHLGYSHPEWLVQRWERRFGARDLALLLRWNNQPPRTYARINPLKTTPDKLIERWRGEEVSYDFVRADWLEDNQFFELKAHPPLHRLPSFIEGWFYIQDPSTGLAIHELRPQPGDTLLDLCAAPGGKLAHAAALMRNQGRILAHDSQPDRLKRVQENCARLGVTCVQTATPEDLNPLTTGMRHHRILLDAPCSNTGVMRRRVDLRWRIEPAELVRLAGAQRELLSQAAGLLAPGGVLVYSTCSLEPEENEDVARQFLEANPGWEIRRERLLAPFREGFDGAYVAVLARREPQPKGCGYIPSA